MSHNTTVVPSLGLRIGLACEAGLSTGMQRQHVSPQRRKKERKKEDMGSSLVRVRFDSHLYWWDNIKRAELTVYWPGQAGRALWCRYLAVAALHETDRHQCRCSEGRQWNCMYSLPWARQSRVAEVERTVLASCALSRSLSSSHRSTPRCLPYVGLVLPPPQTAENRQRDRHRYYNTRLPTLSPAQTAAVPWPHGQ